MRRGLWGRSAWLWGLQVLIVAGCLVLLGLAESAKQLVVPVLILVAQIAMTWSTYDAWRKAERRRALDAARYAGVVPPSGASGHGDGVGAEGASDH